MNKKKYIISRGFTILELLISLFISVLVYNGVSLLGRNIFFFNGVIQNNANSEFEIRKAFKMMTQEIRSMGVSNEGGYPLVSSASSTIKFFYDLNSDGTMDMIRYYISGNKLMKGVTVPTGNPLSFDTAVETTSTVVSNVYNGSVALFSYYDTNYAGTTTPLSLPVTPSSVRLVKINLLINANPKKSSIVTPYSTQVTIRNLKDNL